MATVRVAIRIGETLKINATGPCGSDLSATPQKVGVLKVVGTGSIGFQAVGVGRVLLPLDYGACDDFGGFDKGPEGCHGGIASFGSAVVTVVR